MEYTQRKIVLSIDRTPPALERSELPTDLESIQVELINNTSQLSGNNKHVQRDTKKLEEVENDSTYTDEKRQLCRDRLDDLNAEKGKARNTVTKSKTPSNTSCKD